MEYFINQQLIETSDGYTLTLYLDQQLTEFAAEFEELSTTKQLTLREQVKAYITNNFPNIKIKTINIMMGSLLVASLPFAAINTSFAETTTSNNLITPLKYEVQQGDTLSEIAAKYNLTVSQLKNTNQLTTDLIYIGQTLTIPQSSSTYIVRVEDTLSAIANKYNLTVSQLKTANNLTTDLIKVGQQLSIPTSKEEITNQLPNGIYTIGNSGFSVKAIQKTLNNLGYSVVEDGIYGSATKAAILEFQSVKNLSQDGTYGPQTKISMEQSLAAADKQITNPEHQLTLVNKSNSLPANYTPQQLVVPNVPFPFAEFHEKKLMRQDAASALEDLFEQATADGIDLYATSGYRSYERQENIFNSKVNRYGFERANQFSAQPGESEHQTGLAMDITSPTVNFYLTQNFGETKEGQWLRENAPKYGFIIRYPEHKESITGYSYEPWHIRYIGTNHAPQIADNDLTLEEYLGRA
ncbi:MAG: D-alanyl-D-alanine carboxypeptidase family protein [Bacillota bacterium]